jgi:hypothetical protein
MSSTSIWLAPTDNCPLLQIIGIKILLWFTSFFVNFEAATWDDKVVSGIDFVERSVLQIPFLMMSLMRYITPTLDEMYVTVPTETSGKYLKKLQVHGFSRMGRSNLWPEAQNG